MRLLLLAVALALVSIGIAQPAFAEAPERPLKLAASQSVESRTPVFTMDQVYKSMFGPIDYDRLMLSSEPPMTRKKRPEVAWITGLSARILDADGQPQSSEYFCHSNLRLASLQPVNRMRIFGREKPNKRKMFTLVQGHTEIRFPPGFGIPVLSNDSFGSQVMVMNPTQPEEPVQVRVETKLDFVRNADLESEMKPLYVVSLILKATVDSPETQLLTDQHEHSPHESCADDELHSEAVVPVDISPTGRKAPTVFQSNEGQAFTTIWYVPPGRHVYRHHLGDLRDRIPERTRAHYISAHLHPFGTSIELIDHTIGESVFKATARNHPDRVALEEITHYSSVEGVEIDPTHDYELVAVYENSSDIDVDSMAVIYLYLHDKQLKLRFAKRN